MTAYLVSNGYTTVTVSGRPAATRVTFSGLTNFQTYKFTVTAVNTAGTGPASTTASGIPFCELARFIDMCVHPNYRVIRSWDLFGSCLLPRY